MMIRSLVIPHPPPPPRFGSFMEGCEGGLSFRHGVGGSRCSSSNTRMVISSSASSSSSRSDSDIPKLKPFSRNLLEKVLKETPLIQKAINEISDYCTTLEGDECYSCWRAYFELKDLEQVAPKVDLERTIVESNGITALIGSIHRSVSIYNLKKKDEEEEEVAPSAADGHQLKQENHETQHDHMPDGLPKTAEELEEEEQGRMVDSAHTRLLRAMGKYPAWYTPPPDHQSD